MNLFELFASFHITGMDFVLSYYREGLQLIDIHTFKLKKIVYQPWLVQKPSPLGQFLFTLNT